MPKHNIKSFAIALLCAAAPLTAITQSFPSDPKVQTIKAQLTSQCGKKPRGDVNHLWVYPKAWAKCLAQGEVHPRTEANLKALAQAKKELQ